MTTRLLAAALLCLVVTSVPGTPAVALDPPTPPALAVLALDSSAPGLLSAQITTPHPQTWVRITRDDGFDLGRTRLVEGTGPHDLELETWGLDPARVYLLRLSACEVPEWEDCATTTAPFTPTESDTTFTFSEDRVLSGTEEATLTVEGPLGGGRLSVRMYAQGDQQLVPGGQPLWLTDSTFVWARRCADLGCVDLTDPVTYEVAKGAPVTRTSVDPDQHVDPDTTAAPDVRLGLGLGGSAVTSYEGWIVDGYGRPFSSETVAGSLTADADGVAGLELDMSPVPPHTTSRFVVRLEHMTPEGAVSRWARPGLPVVVRQPPVVTATTVSRDVFHPAPDGYRDTVHVRAHVTDSVETRVEVVHLRTGEATSLPVDTPAEGDVLLSWDRTDPQGRPLDSGRYAVRLVATDEHGLVTAVEAGEVRLDWRALTSVRRTYTVSARGSLVRRTEGSCARVVLGPGEWEQGVGYRVGTCQASVGASSLHTTGRAPRGWVRGTVSLGTYGRAAAHEDGDRFWVMTRLENRDGGVLQRRTLPVAEGWSTTRRFRSGRVLDDHGRTQWSVYADHGSHYDARAFRLVFDGSALR